MVYTAWCTINWWCMKREVRENGGLYSAVQDKLLPYTVWGSINRFYYLYLVRRRWEDNIKMDFQEVGWGFGDWMELA